MSAVKVESVKDDDAANNKSHPVTSEPSDASALSAETSASSPASSASASSPNVESGSSGSSIIVPTSKPSVSFAGDSISYTFLNLVEGPFRKCNVAFQEILRGDDASYAARASFLVTASGNRVVLRNLATVTQFALGFEAMEDIVKVLPLPLGIVNETEQSGTSGKAATTGTSGTSGTEGTGVLGSEDQFMLVIDAAGRVTLLNSTRLCPLSRMALRERVTAATISPDGRYVAFGYQSGYMSTWRLPCAHTQWQFSKVNAVRACGSGRVHSIEWSQDSMYMIVASEDTNVAVFALDDPDCPKSTDCRKHDFYTLLLTGHTSSVRYAAFSGDSRSIYSVDTTGVCLFYDWYPSTIEDDDESAAVPLSSTKRRRLREEREEKAAKLRKFEKLEDDEYAARIKEEAEEAEQKTFISQTTRYLTQGMWRTRYRQRLYDPVEKKGKIGGQDFDQEGNPKAHSEGLGDGSGGRKGLGHVRSAAYHAGRNLLAVGTETGNVLLVDIRPFSPSLSYHRRVGHYSTSDGPSNPCGVVTHKLADVWAPTNHAQPSGDGEGEGKGDGNGEDKGEGKEDKEKKLMEEGGAKAVLKANESFLARQAVTDLRFNASGLWLGMSCGQTGSIAVWEWRSESFVCRESSEDSGGSTSVALLPSGVSERVGGTGGARLSGSSSLIAVGDHSGRVSCWDAVGGCRLKQFQRDSIAPVVGLTFTSQLNTLIAAHRDGNIFAYELMRLKRFRRMATPKNEWGVPTQLSSNLSVDVSGEIVAVASGESDCHIFLFSLQTGALLDTIKGHEAAITGVKFTTNVDRPGLLASISEDGMVRVSDIYGRDGKGGEEEWLTPPFSGIGLALEWNPAEPSVLAASYSGGRMVLWDAEEGEILSTIEAGRDIHIGRLSTQRTRVDGGGKGDREGGLEGYTSLSFSTNGYYLACANRKSPRVCIYDTRSGGLVFYFHLTQSRSIDGILRHLDSRSKTASGVSLAELDLSDSDLSDSERRRDRFLEERLDLPGAKMGILAMKASRKTLIVFDLKISTDSRLLAVATNHGTFCYSLNQLSTVASAAAGLLLTKPHASFSQLTTAFAPAYLDKHITEKNYWACLSNKNLKDAFLIALSLNHPPLIANVYQKLRPQQISLFGAILPERLLPVLLNFIQLAMNTAQDAKAVGVVTRPSADAAPGGAAATSAATSAGTSAATSAANNESVLAHSAHLFEMHTRWLQVLMERMMGAALGPSGNEDQNGKGPSQSSSQGPIGLDTGAAIRPLLLMLLKQLEERRSLMRSLFDSNVAVTQYLASQN